MRLTIRQKLIGVAGAAVVLAGYSGGGCAGGLRLLLSPDVLPSPSPMDLLRFGTFVACCVSVLLLAASDLAWVQARSEGISQRARGWRKFILPATAVMCVLTLVFTVVVAGFDRRSRGFTRRASRYYDLCVQYSPKAHPELTGDPISATKFHYYDKLYRKYLDASGRPWAPVDPDPPEPE